MCHQVPQHFGLQVDTDLVMPHDVTGKNAALVADIMQRRTKALAIYLYSALENTGVAAMRIFCAWSSLPRAQLLIRCLEGAG